MMTMLPKERFRWRTMEGQVLTIDEMDTKHVFNSMKMEYNHLAIQCGLPTVWFNHRYSDKYTEARVQPKETVRVILLFIAEIEERKDLPLKYREPYEAIIQSLAAAFRMPWLTANTLEKTNG